MKAMKTLLATKGVRIKFKYVIYLLAVSCCSFGERLFEETQFAENIHVKLVTMKDTYLLGEPVWADVVVSNGASRPIEIHIGNSPDDGITMCKVDEENDPLLSFYPYTQDYFLDKESVGSGSNFVKRVLISHYLGFSSPGKRRIQYEVNYPIYVDGQRLKVFKNSGKVCLNIYKDDLALKQGMLIIAKGLESKSFQQRASTLDVLSSTRHPYALPYLASALDEEEHAVICLALARISEIDSQESIDIIRKFIERNSDRSLGVYAKNQLRKAQSRAERKTAEVRENDLRRQSESM
ncbi:hypothetical protein P4C99_21225 [Pontiellaceae bacterium B1224]|nr:hypothetical protein [Pontiellaceae bacterium B1224]